MEDILVKYVREWDWLLLVALVSFIFKDVITNFAIGLQILLGNDFNVDDIVYIRGNKKARIVKQNLWKTMFYVYGHGRKFIVPNKSLWKLDIEKENANENSKKITKDELNLFLSYLKMKRNRES